MKKSPSNKEDRHMVAIPDIYYKKIAEFCEPHSFIIGKWIGKICVIHINAELSGSYKK